MLKGLHQYCICWHSFSTAFLIEGLRLHSFPSRDPTPRTPTCWQGSSQKGANNLANLKSGVHAGPKQKPWAIHAPSVPGACQHATSLEDTTEACCQALPLHPLLLPRAFAS